MLFNNNYNKASKYSRRTKLSVKGWLWRTIPCIVVVGFCLISSGCGTEVLLYGLGAAIAADALTTQQQTQQKATNQIISQQSRISTTKTNNRTTPPFTRSYLLSRKPPATMQKPPQRRLSTNTRNNETAMVKERSYKPSRNSPRSLRRAQQGRLSTRANNRNTTPRERSYSSSKKTATSAHKLPQKRLSTDVDNNRRTTTKESSYSSNEKAPISKQKSSPEPVNRTNEVPLDTIIAQAIDSYNCLDWTQASRLFQQAVKREDTSSTLRWKCWVFLGGISYQNGNLIEARRNFKQAIEQDSKALPSFDVFPPHMIKFYESMKK